MNKSKVILNRHFVKNDIDPRLYGSFVEHMGSTVYGGVFEEGSPFSDEKGIRLDVLELVKKLHLPVIRYPGGNFTCSYFWEDSVGPRAERPTRMELAWRQIEPNTFGIDEWYEWTRRVDTETIMAINLGTRGIQDAANVVEYCNHPGGTYYSDLRRKHGRQQPYGFKTWCVGNETDGPWQIARRTPEDYAWTCAEAAKAMKRVDDTLELVAVGSSHCTMPTYPLWDRTVLEAAYDYVDYISLHHYIPAHEDQPLGEYLAGAEAMDGQMKAIIATCDHVKAAKRSKKTINLCFDEYNVTHPNGIPHEDWSFGGPIDRASYDMKDTLLFGSVLLALLRNSDRVKIACQSLLVNTGPLIVCDKTHKAFVNSLYWPMLHASTLGRGKLLYQQADIPTYETEKAGPLPLVDLECVYREAEGDVVLFAVNRSPEAMPLSATLEDFGPLTPVEHLVVRSDDLDAHNDFDTPEAIGPSAGPAVTVDGAVAETVLPGYSWNVVRIKVG